jgi:methyltransferase family protein
MRSMTDPGAREWQLAAAMDGFLTTQLLYVAARLGIAEALANGPRSADDLARAVGAEPVALGRVLRGLAVMEAT